MKNMHFLFWQSEDWKTTKNCTEERCFEFFLRSQWVLNLSSWQNLKMLQVETYSWLILWTKKICRYCTKLDSFDICNFATGTVQTWYGIRLEWPTGTMSPGAGRSHLFRTELVVLNICLIIEIWMYSIFGFLKIYVPTWYLGPV